MGLRGRKARGQTDWMVRAAELMVQEKMSFSAACQALGVKFETAAEERAAEWSDAFRDVVDVLGMRFHARMGDNPLLTKGVMVGWLMTAIERLGQLDQWDKIAIPAKLVCDIKGFTKEDSSAPVLVNLTQKDIDELRAKMREAQEKDAVVVVVDGSKPN